MLRIADMTQTRNTAIFARLGVRWFRLHTGNATTTQRSTLMRTRRKMLLYMFTNIAKELTLHRKSPKNHVLYIMVTMLKGKKEQKTRSEMARLR